MRFMRAVRCEEPVREVPAFVDDDGRLSFSQIAQRAQIERVHWYSVLAFGTQAYLRSKQVAARGLREDAGDGEGTKARA